MNNDQDISVGGFLADMEQAVAGLRRKLSSEATRASSDVSWCERDGHRDDLR